MLLAKFILNYLLVKDITVIVDLFSQKNIFSGAILHCYNAQTNLAIHRIYNDNQLKFSWRNMNKHANYSIPHSFGKIGMVVNTSCDGWSTMFDLINEKQIFKSPFSWFIITENLTKTVDVLSRYKIELDSDVTIISKNNNIHVLHEMYYTGFYRNGRLIVSEVGRRDEVLHIEPKDRKNLKGLVLRTTVVIPQSQKIVNKTFVRFLEEEEPDLIKVDPMHKFKYYLALKYFRDMFNITYDFQRTLSWGYQTNNGTFDGMVGALQRMETDITGSPLFIRADRANAIDYIAETWLTRPTFIFRHPKHPNGFITIYTRPLTTRVWYCIMALMALATLALAVLLNLKVIEVPGDEQDVSFSLAFLLIWSAICQQGMSLNRNSNAVKVVAFVTFLFALTLYQYYNATVVSTLLRETPKNIRTLKDLLHSNLQAGIEDIAYNKDFFRHTTDPLAREFYQKKVVHTTPYKYFYPEQGMDVVKKGGFAFYIDAVEAYRIIRRKFSEKEICELQEVNLYEPQKLGVAVVKHSAYKEILAHGIRKLKECGILTRLQLLWDEPRPRCVRTPDSSTFSVSLQEFSTALIVLAVGYLAALAILVGEMLYFRLKKKRVIEFRH